ncbi:hypothetical protein EMIT047CA2_60220 [Pseudomonas soli]
MKMGDSVGLSRTCLDPFSPADDWHRPKDKASALSLHRVLTTACPCRSLVAQFCHWRLPPELYLRRRLPLLRASSQPPSRS